MIKIETIVTALLLCFVIVACDNHKKLYDEVMAIHDEAMLKMDRIMKLKQTLKSKADSLKSDTTKNFPAELEEIKSLQTKLDTADESMMVWMREFHQDYESIAKAEVMEYLNRQKQRITQVGMLMNEAIADAEEYLAE